MNNIDGETSWKIPLRSPRRRWQDVMCSDLKERFCEDISGSCTVLASIIGNINYRMMLQQCYIIHMFLYVCLDEGKIILVFQLSTTP